jgi:CHASE3 domain sensor protein
MRRTQAHDAADFDVGRGVNRLPVGIQVVLAAAGLLVLVVASPVAAILVVTRLNHSEIVLNARDAAYGQAVSAIALTATTIGNAERSYLATGDPALIAQTDRQIDRAHALFSTASDAATNAAERTALGDGRASFERWVLAVRHDLSAYRAGQRQQAQIDAQGQTLALRDAFDESTIHAQTLCAASIQAAADKIEQRSSRSVIILLVALLTALGAGSIIVVWLTRSLIRPIYKILDLFLPRQQL